MTAAPLRIIAGTDAAPAKPKSVERTFGSPAFIRRDRNPDLPQPERRFVATVKRDGDVVISTLLTGWRAK